MPRSEMLPLKVLQHVHSQSECFNSLKLPVASRLDFPEVQCAGAGTKVRVFAHLPCRWFLPQREVFVGSSAVVHDVYKLPKVFRVKVRGQLPPIKSLHLPIAEKGRGRPHRLVCPAAGQLFVELPLWSICMPMFPLYPASACSAYALCSTWYKMVQALLPLSPVMWNSPPFCTVYYGVLIVSLASTYGG